MRHPDGYIKQLAVPRCLREDVLKSYHDSIAGGAHLGFERTYRAIQLKYYWPGMYQNVADYVRSCKECQLAKRPTHHAHAPLTPLPIVEPFSRIHMDILGPLTTSTEGYKYILLIVDSFSKWPEAFPLKTQDSKEIGRVLFKEYFCRYGAPHTIVTDRGQNFMSKLVSAICEIFQVTRHYTSSYHPQTNATCERMNSTVAQCIRTYIHEDQTNWPELLSGIMMAIRMSPSTQSSDMSPFHIIFGKEMNLPFDTSLIPKDGTNQDAKAHVTNLMKQLQTVREIARNNIDHARQQQKEQYDKHSKEPTFSAGQAVLLHKPFVPKGLSPKLHNHWDGPYYITQECPNLTYTLRKCAGHKQVRSRIHANRLKPYDKPDHRKSLDPPQTPLADNHLLPDETQPNTQQNPEDQQNQNAVPPDHPIQAHNNHPQPPLNRRTTAHQPADVNHDPTQHQNFGYVENLLQYKFINGKKCFLVKWYGSSVKTWEPEEHINPALVERYHITKTQSGKARKRKKGSCFRKTH